MRTKTNPILTGIVLAMAMLGAVRCADVADATGKSRNDLSASVTGTTADRPFSGRMTGILTAVSPFAPGSSDDCNANFTGDPAAPGPSISLFDEAAGNFQHLGRVQLRALSCIDPASSFSSGTGSLTAANGDQLFIAFENTSQPDPADPTRLFAFGPQRVTGGTGRFQNASGAQSCNFTIVLTSPSAGTIEGNCDGRLIY